MPNLMDSRFGKSDHLPPGTFSFTPPLIFIKMAITADGTLLWIVAMSEDASGSVKFAGEGAFFANNIV